MIIEKQVEIVKVIASSIRKPWSRIVFNVEVGDVDGSEIVSGLGHFWIEENKEQMFLSGFACQLFRDLRSLMKDNDSRDRAWSICDIEISSDGKYNFQFSYDAPKRISELNKA